MGWCRSTNTYTDAFFLAGATSTPMNLHSHTYLKWGYDVVFSMKVKKMKEKRWQIQRGNCVVQKKRYCFLQYRWMFSQHSHPMEVLLYMQLKGINSQFSVFSKSKNLGNCSNSFDFCKTFNITNNISKDAISPLELSPNKHLAHSRIK